MTADSIDADGAYLGCAEITSQPGFEAVIAARRNAARRSLHETILAQVTGQDAVDSIN
ncbi:hypothetical protein ACYG9R_19245 [Mesorhizobium sp. RSR565B]|uniref:hypothetical protein n=1 Tax=Mesorhizobium sp. L103C565B0 TaxID=1287094 RepID=UPI0003CFFE36|nr:hypothetical protein [Mesorhizobium sp. L103C565B0]ESZ43662.1 hypothetical protein X730_27840 [Mesorhizobium sp. L103C565B0]